jgi:hypothetical protein
MLTAVTQGVIERIFAVTDPLGISREALVVPLRPRAGGGLRRLPDGRIEIVVDGADLEGFLERLPDALRGL